MKYPSRILFFILLIGMFFAFAEEPSAEVLTLPEGLKIVAEKSRIITISRSDEQIAEADAESVRSKLLPTINAFAGWSALAHQPKALFGPLIVPVSDKNFLAYSISIQQTLFDFRGNAARYDASRTAFAAKRLETQRVRNFAAIEFVLVYLDLLEQEKMITVAEKETEALDAHRRNAQSLYDEGVITKNDLLQAEVRISDARQRLLTARTTRSLLASRINSILMRPLRTEVQIHDIEEGQAGVVSSFSVEAAWELAEKQRAELQIADETLKALGFQETARRSDYYPRLFVTGGYDYTENKYQLHESNWSMTLGLSLNLFSGGETRAELKKIGYQREKLLEQREKLRDDIRLEVEQYLLQSLTASERLQVAKDSVRQAEENLRINIVKYEEGIGTGSDVLDAVSLLTIARTNQYRTLYDLRKSEAAVFYATGRDLLEVYR